MSRTRISPCSMRLAISTSPSRVSSETLPILRRYMRTGSLVRDGSSSVSSSRFGMTLRVASFGFCGVLRLLAREHLDALVDQSLLPLAELLGVDEVRRQQLVQLVVGDVALLLAEGNELLLELLAVHGARLSLKASYGALNLWCLLVPGLHAGHWKSRGAALELGEPPVHVGALRARARAPAAARRARSRGGCRRRAGAGCAGVGRADSRRCNCRGPVAGARGRGRSRRTARRGAGGGRRGR
jgi:hypothetical protein